MASKSNTEPFLATKTPKLSDPYHNLRRMESSRNTCVPNIPVQSSLFATSSSTTTTLAQKRWSTNSLDDEIKSLLQKKLVLRVIGGRPFETLQFHRKELVRQLADWIGFFDSNDDEHDVHFKHKLVSLLATACKQNNLMIPLENSEWTKLLNLWLRVNTSGAVLSGREIYKILAVDGFRGFRPKDLKSYLPGVLLPLRNEYKMHVRGVRNMYDFFEKNESVSSLTGTDSACVVFLALVEWYEGKDGLLLDDQIAFRVRRAKSWAEGFLQQHGEYYRDVRNVDSDLLKELGRVYYCDGGEWWKVVGEELLANLTE